MCEIILIQKLKDWSFFVKKNLVKSAEIGRKRIFFHVRFSVQESTFQ